ncbi:MAG: glucoamylase family protein, partial [Eubacteriales bacterium]
MAAFIWLLPYGFWKAFIPACLLLLPFYALCRESADILGGYLASHRENVHPLLRLQLDRIPDEGRTLVVITTLLTGGSHDDVIFDNLKRFYLRNREDNVCFGVLADLPCAKQQVCAEDDTVLHHAENRIAALRKRYGDHFVLLVRKRNYAPGEGVYMGWERKRGAVLTLVRYLRGKVRDDAFLYAYTPGNFLMSAVRYVCTLDADTELPAGAVRDMVSALLHDANKPVIKDGCVVRGCAIVQPRMAVTPMGASATRFTRLCAGQGGSDPYDRYTTDGEEYLYGAGSFCGKGMFDADVFLDVLDRAFPCDAVLSHDFLEGALLGCRNLHDVTLQDTVPKSVLSYYERQSRWVRGDTQALRFCFAHYKNADGVRIRNPMPPAMRLRGIDHVLYALMPWAMVRCVLLVSFFSLPWYTVVLLWIAAFSARLLRPFLMLFQKSAWRGLFRRFFTSVMPVMWHSTAWLGFRIRFAAYEAWVNLRAFFTALWRMLVSHKHMLAWVTAGEAERKKHNDTLSGQFSVYSVSVLLGAVLLFSPFLFVKIMGVVWITAPVSAFFLNQKENSRRKRRAPIHSGADADTDAPISHTAILPDAGRYFADMWRYFSDYVNEKTHYLPPDNVQWFPQTEERAAHRTSPTNIGLYLTACVAACDFGLLSPKGLARRLSDTLGTLTHMETCRGHFFNWYDTDTAQPLGDRYVSAVDSGNLACALICTAGGAAEYAPEEASLLEIAHALTAMADRMDFAFLFKEDKGLLSLGYDAAHERYSEGCYDLYCSEARTAVYFAAASGQIPARAWERLSRPVTENGGHIGILSWSGSAFEYFMPELWLPVIENTLTEEMLVYAAEAQYASRMVLHDTSGAYPVFGKSEGAFFAFDADKIFQYKPCGVGRLAVCGNMDAEQLVMPYALFLMLPFADDRIPAAKTLRALEACGMYGKYGFYEALDMTRTRVGSGWAVVRSVMAHHLGMSMIALANTVFHGVFVKRFLSDDRMEAMQMLLWERIPTDAAAELILPARMEHDDAVRYQYIRSRNAETESSTDAEAERYGILSNTYAYVAASSRGDMRFFCGTRAVAAEDYHDESALPPMVFLRCAKTGEVYAPFAAGYPDREQGKVRFSFICTDDEIRYTAQYRNGYTASFRITVSPSDSTFSFTASLNR